MAEEILSAESYDDEEMKKDLDALYDLGTRETKKLIKTLECMYYIGDEWRQRAAASSARVKELEAEVKSLKAQLENSNQQFNGLNERFNRLNDRFNGLNGQFEGVNRQFEGVNGRFDGLNNRFDGLNGQFDGLNGRFDGLSGGSHDGATINLRDLELALKKLDDKLKPFDADREELKHLRADLKKFIELLNQMAAPSKEQSEDQPSDELPKEPFYEPPEEPVDELLDEPMYEPPEEPPSKSYKDNMADLLSGKRE